MQSSILHSPNIERLIMKPIWRIKKYDSMGRYIGDSSFPDNAVLFQGWANLWNLFIGGGGTAHSNTNAKLRVGNSSTAVVQTQTGLLGASTFTMNMDATYPQITGANNQNVLFQGTAGTTEANFDWNEFGLSDGTELFNRQVSAQGTKQSGQTWILQLELQGQ